MSNLVVPPAAMPTKYATGRVAAEAALEDTADPNNVRNNFGTTGDGVPGDTNGDDVVNIEDLNAVRNNFGAENPVPEPPSLVLLAAGAAGLAVLRWKRSIKKKH